jgi:release factor glutamine methyltransferase
MRTAAPETIGCAIKAATYELAATSETARLDAEVLLAQALRRERTYLRAWPERLLTAEESQNFWHSIERRATGMPVAYLTGEKEFWSRVFEVCPGVLIPRPETELLIEFALDFLPETRPVEVLDLGTGSGIIAVTLAAERPLAGVTAVDLSETAIAAAQGNAARHGVGNIRFLLSDWFEQISEDRIFDLIVSNPPYVADQDPHLAQGDVRFEPELALKGGKFGLDALETIASDARSRLKPDGRLIFEHGYDQAETLAELLRGLGYHAIRHHLDLQGHRRATSASLEPFQAIFRSAR